MSNERVSRGPLIARVKPGNGWPKLEQVSLLENITKLLIPRPIIISSCISLVVGQGHSSYDPPSLFVHCNVAVVLAILVDGIITGDASEHSIPLNIISIVMIFWSEESTKNKKDKTKLTSPGATVTVKGYADRMVMGAKATAAISPLHRWSIITR